MSATMLSRNGTDLVNVVLLMEAREAAVSGRGARLRRAAGLSQAELAATCGVTPSCVSHWEAGERRPRGDAAVAYARVLRELDERQGSMPPRLLAALQAGEIETNP